MKKIFALLLPLLGIAGGIGTAVFLKPPAEDHSAASDAHTPGTDGSPAQAETSGETARTSERSFVKIGRQTIIPVVADGETRALMLFELAVDVPAGKNDLALQLEPRLRDAFLRELFQMSYTGAFETNFTDERVIAELRRNLTHVARKHLDSGEAEVLILDVMRQEL